AARQGQPIPTLCRRVRNLESVKARGVVNKELALAFLANVFSLEKDIDRAIEPVSVRNIRAIEPALIAKLLDRKRQQLLINLEAKVNLPPLNIFLRQMLGVVASSEVFSGPGSGKPAIVGDSLHEAWHPGAT